MALNQALYLSEPLFLALLSYNGIGIWPPTTSCRLWLREMFPAFNFLLHVTSLPIPGPQCMLSVC